MIEGSDGVSLASSIVCGRATRCVRGHRKRSVAREWRQAIIRTHQQIRVRHRFTRVSASGRIAQFARRYGQDASEHASIRHRGRIARAGSDRVDLRACRWACRWILEFIQRELHRRQLGYGRGGRQRIEKDQADILAGVRHGKTIGAPIAVRIENRDWKNWEKALPVEDTEGADAAGAKGRAAPLTAPRPGHADLAGAQKFNLHDARYILERASARETAARVAAGAFAKLAAARIWRDGAEPHDCGGPCAARTRGERGRKLKLSARIWNRRCAAWMPRPKRG